MTGQNLLLPTFRQNQADNWHGLCCRLLYLVGQLRLGGLERQLFYLLANLDHVRYRPAVVVWNLNRGEKYYKEIEALKIPVTGFPTEWSPLYKLRSFRYLVRQIAPEIIHSFSFHTNFAAYYGARGTSALAIGSLRSDFVKARKEGGLIRGALNARWPSHVISNSSSCADAARQISGPFAPRHLTVVRNGLDLKCFYSSNISSKGYVAAIGSLFQIKRWDRLVRAVHRLKADGIGNVEFRIAGDGPLRRSLENMVRELGLSLGITLVGESHDIPAFLREARLLVHTSESEGCPNAVMEAMACGLPVVAMKTGDIPYLVEDEKTGFVVPQGDEAALAEKIARLIKDDSLCRLMGKAARAKAEREFGLHRLVSETLAAYRTGGWTDAA